MKCVSPSNHFLFTPLLPSSALGTVEFRCIQEPIRAIRGMAGHYLQAKARSVDFKKQTLLCEEIFHGFKFEVDYDALIIATGNKTNTFGIKNILEREGKEVFFLKHLWHARQIRNHILECFERAAIPLLDPNERERLLSFIVVGGGPTSVEFVGELSDFLKEDVARFFPELKQHIRVTIVEAGGNLLGSFDKQLISYVEQRFRSSGVEVRLKTSVTALSDDGSTASLSDGTTLPVGMMVWSAGLSPVRFVEQLGPEVKRVGGNQRILVDDKLLVDSTICRERMFAIGDCAVNKETPLAPLAQVARSQAMWLAQTFNNIADPNDIMKTPMKQILKDEKPYTYFHMGSMATLGGWRGVIDFTSMGNMKHHLNAGKHSGFLSFIVWRSAYWGRQVSIANKLLIPIYWMKTWIFGRDISRF